ncbi:uncharacterized protein [Rutidosis leptorrhynchoides]|uniref:uncharacterized protein n=1 Tax=Rutidosis leptorrhynchoides TaxID=125765 RepID=UPI003A99F1E7
MYDALADLGASINFMPHSLYLKLNLGDLKPTRMCVRLADRTYNYPIGIAENLPAKVNHLIFPADFVVLEMEEDSKVPLILGRPFLNTADAIVCVKEKNLSLGVGDDRIILNIDKAMKHPMSPDDECFQIDIVFTDEEYVEEEIPGEDEPFEEITDGFNNTERDDITFYPKEK